MDDLNEELNDLKVKAEEIKADAKVANQNVITLTELISSDEESLNQEVSVCSKCLRPFTSHEEASAIHASIEDNKTKIVSFQSKIDGLKNDMAKIKKDNDDYVIQRDKEIKEKVLTEADIKVILNQNNFMVRFLY